jgi:hypothetical protein
MDALGRANRAGELMASRDAALRPSMKPFGAEGAGGGVTDIVLVATGTGLAAMRPTIELLMRRGRQAVAAETCGGGERRAGHASDGRGGVEDSRHAHESANGDGVAGVPQVRVHLYYGLRQLSHLPWQDELASWVERGELQLTLLLSQQEEPAEADGQCSTDQSVQPVLRAAAERGRALARIAADLRRAAGAAADNETASGGSRTPLTSLLLEAGEDKLYVNQALALDLSVESLVASARASHGQDIASGLSLRGRGARLDNMLVAVCGRSEILGGTERAFLAACSVRHASEAGVFGAGAEVGSHDGGGQGNGAPRVGADGAGERAEDECSGLVAQRLFFNI